MEKKLCQNVCNIDWSPLYTTNCVDTKVNIFTSNIITLYDIHAAIHAIKLKHLPSPWLTEGIKLLLHKKAAAKTKYNCKPTASNLDNYIAVRNRCNRMCRKAQRQHIHTSIENGDPGKVWKFLKTKDFNIDSLNAHFLASSNGAIKTKTLQYISVSSTPSYSPFFFEQFSACNVKSSIVSIASNAVGIDYISRNMILPILDEVLPFYAIFSIMPFPVVSFH